ncbi:MAG: septum formation initiator family protein [Paramuribaculum sp.]|nr:septum formation initiator family protein [Paramuribaculum sp.]MDE5836387.1 septum formation initiator family protein [Paramuribaculum sp.]
MNTRLISVLRWSRRYIRISFVLTVGVLAYVMLFSDNSVIDNYEYQMEIDNLRTEIKECTDSIMYYENLNRRLRTDPATMERIVREQYHMQRLNEDIYLVEE